MVPIPPLEPEAHVARLREIYARLSELNELNDNLAAEMAALGNELTELDNRDRQRVP